MKIHSDFDSGHIEVVQLLDRQNIQLKLTPDNNAEVKQWFHFQLETTKDKLHQIRIINAGESSFVKGWENYQVVASYDQRNWFRVETQFDGQSLIIKHRPTHSNISYAYFTPYSYERHQNLMALAKASSISNHTSLGLTSDNHPIDLLTIGKEGVNKHKIWLIARQHPGETMAEWFIEGLVNRLLSQDELSKKLLETSVFYIVPNMNPDGSVRGNHRTNSNGHNLNREWDNPSESNCPEVYYVQQAMQNKGVDLFIDVHGDEEIPYNFMMGGTSCSLKKQAADFKSDFAKANSDFQIEVDYDTYHAAQSSCCGSSCGNKDLSKASAYVEDKFKCLSLVLEMPFVDNDNAPNKKQGWSSERSFELGYSIAEPIAQITSKLPEINPSNKANDTHLINNKSDKCAVL